MLRKVNDVEKSPEYKAWQDAKEKRDRVGAQIAELKTEEEKLAAQLRSITADPGDLVIALSRSLTVALRRSTSASI